MLFSVRLRLTMTVYHLSSMIDPTPPEPSKAIILLSQDQSTDLQTNILLVPHQPEYVEAALADQDRCHSHQAILLTILNLSRAGLSNTVVVLRTPQTQVSDVARD